MPSVRRLGCSPESRMRRTRNVGVPDPNHREPRRRFCSALSRLNGLYTQRASLSRPPLGPSGWKQ